ncbi:hypothetical protein WISP_129847 [Willisornis vidua]|uniref:CFA20 domain-containing protein n=1 Tax=Willisornis vidua TaxID=1566151 RepID=A0ABQ9CPP5_9PASS|nr:hypothetical protein WISP_129847 [Willisornis vidua]
MSPSPAPRNHLQPALRPRPGQRRHSLCFQLVMEAVPILKGGRFVEIFSAQGKNPGAKWKIFGNPSAIQKEYDKEIKGFVFVLEGSSQVNKMQLPKETRQTLGLIQQFLTLQIFVPMGKDFSTELLITDLGNIKRRLYLSTVHKELSVTPLHAKIPLFMIKRKIWCNLCIDLVAFTSEIFRGAVFQSLDGIIISANCKLRKIFTLKSKPRDTAEKDVTCVVPPVPFESPDVIPRTCQLNTDVPQVTQLLKLTKIHKPEIKCREYPVQETGSLVNRGQGNIHSSKTRHVSHTAFGSKILGPPPSSNRRVSTRGLGEIKEAKERVPKQLKMSVKMKDTSAYVVGFFSFTPHYQKVWIFFLSYNVNEWVFPGRFTKSIQLDGCEQFVATEESACQNLPSAQNASGEHHSSETDDHQVNNKEVFTFSSRPRSAPHGKSPNLSPECCVFPLDLEPDSSGVHEKTPTEDNFEGTDSSEEDDNSELIQGTENLEISHCRQGTSDSAVFKELPLNEMSWKNEYWKNKEHSKYNLDETILPKPQSFTVRKTDSISSQGSLKPVLSLSPTRSKSKFFKAIRNGSEKTERYEGVSDQLGSSISKTSLRKISKENSCLTAQTYDYDSKNYSSDSVSSSELQMLASMRRQQNEELGDPGISHGLSTSQIDTCNVGISTSSDDGTATWTSSFPPPFSQEHHYQREMSPLSHSNPRDWLNVFSPPIIPGSQQLEEHTKSPTKQSIQGVDDFNAEEDEEVLTLLYDPCLNCYFDPNSGKYYELA